MLKLLLSISLLFSLTAKAEETDEVDLLAPEAEETVSFQAENERVETNLPTCSDEALVKKVVQVLQEYYKTYPVTSLYEKRQRALQQRFMEKYEEVATAGFTAKKNRAVADKLLMTKINLGLDNSKIRLCKSTMSNEKFKTIYLMIFNNQYGETDVYILNFLNNPKEELHFTLHE